MGKKYRITLPMSKEKLLYLLNQTTQNLTIQNQVYRKTTLANYDKEKETLFISYAAGSMVFVSCSFGLISKLSGAILLSEKMLSRKL